ncbi:MAG TPA: outer membrane lipoprotein-sorting protein [Nevskiaceae bacterium]|nr:outer membrane lipoprotein-sorting protein [Nevskiaceae bacterium]
MNRRFRLLLALMLTAPLWTPAASAAESGAERIVDCMRDNVPQAQRIRRFELREYDAEGLSRTYQGRVAVRIGGTGEGEAAGWNLVVHMTHPADVSGSAYLYKAASLDAAPHTYVYLSGLRRVRHVSGGADVAGSFLGSNFTFQELRQLAGGFEGSAVRVDARDTVAGRPVWVLSVATGGAGARESARVWTDEQTCVPLRVDFLADGQVAKRYRVQPEALRREGRYWFASEAQMSTESSGSRSVLRLDGVDSQARLSSVDFNPAQFYQRN